MNCPNCGGECECDEVDIGVGVLHGPYGCPACHWSQDSYYDSSKGESQAAKDNPNFYVDNKGGMIRKSAIVERAEHFGIPKEVTEEVFKVQEEKP